MGYNILVTFKNSDEFFVYFGFESQYQSKLQNHGECEGLEVESIETLTF